MRLQDGSGAGVDLRFFLPPPLTPGEFKNNKLIQLFRDTAIIVNIPGAADLMEYCLQALLSHSTISEQCQVIVESLTLPLLTLVIEAYPDNARIKSIIGKIISNILNTIAQSSNQGRFDNFRFY